VNDGKGNFTKDSTALRSNYAAKSCVKAADYDNDGDLDLFVGGRVGPGSYPEPVSSLILRNDSQNGEIKFTDVTRTVAPQLQQIGMVCDATWTDADNDGKVDLISCRRMDANHRFQKRKRKVCTGEDKLIRRTGVVEQYNCCGYR
jgi:hypothetical protein